MRVDMFIRRLKSYLKPSAYFHTGCQSMKSQSGKSEGLSWEQGSDPIKQDTWVGPPDHWSPATLPSASV